MKKAVLIFGLLAAINATAQSNQYLETMKRWEDVNQQQRNNRIANEKQDRQRALQAEYDAKMADLLIRRYQLDTQIDLLNQQFQQLQRR